MLLYLLGNLLRAYTGIVMYFPIMQPYTWLGFICESVSKEEGDKENEATVKVAFN